MSTLMLTCAGESRRFPNHRPKWAITHPSGNLMAAESIRRVYGYTRLVVALRDDTYPPEQVADEFELAGFLRPDVVIVGATGHQVATVLKTLELADVDGCFTVKDCDNQFGYVLPQHSAVAVADLHTCGKVNPANKSYVRTDGGRVEHIRERSIIGHQFCCGAYTFASPAPFVSATRNGQAGHRFVSEVIATLLHEGWRFDAHDVSGYVDWGTEDDWNAYCAGFKTLFVDIDGVLVGSSHRTFAPRWTETPVIAKNVDYLNALHATGQVEIILVTSRPDAMRERTERQLESLNYDRLVMGLRNCARLIVNDVSLKRGANTCFAINIERDSDLLERYMKAAT